MMKYRRRRFSREWEEHHADARRRVVAMQDGELVLALLYFQATPEPELRAALIRNEREEAFVRGFREWYVRHGDLTWKQREVARSITVRNVMRLEREARTTVRAAGKDVDP